MQHPLDAVDVHAIVIDHRATTRTIVVAIEVFVRGRVLELPERFGRVAFPATEPRLVVVAVELEEPALTDRRHAVADAHGFVPDDAQPFVRPGGNDARLRRDAVAGGSEEAWPIALGAASGRFAGEGRWQCRGRRRTTGNSGSATEGAEEAEAKESTHRLNPLGQCLLLRRCN